MGFTKLVVVVAAVAVAADVITAGTADPISIGRADLVLASSNVSLLFGLFTFSGELDLELELRLVLVLMLDFKLELEFELEFFFL